MLHNKPSFRFLTPALKFNLLAIALLLMSCAAAYANSISGVVYNENSTLASPHNYINHARVCANGSPTVCDYTSSVTTYSGVYSLTGLGSGAYDLCVDKTAGENATQIDHADALRVSAHIAGTNPFPNDFLKWAADASCNLSITSFDAGKIDAWPSGSYGCTGQWRFVPDDGLHSVPWPTSDASVCKHYDSLPSVDEVDFDGILKGEVTGDWDGVQ